MTDYRPTVADNLVAAEAILDLVRAEYARARKKHAPMQSAHEGFAVIYEEFMVELADHVWHDTAKTPDALHEAVQVAAMAVAFAVEVCCAE